MSDDYQIRTMTRDEIDLAVDWAATEGWNPGVNDADCFHRADPHGFLVGLLNDEPIASISVVKYGAGFGFLGFYIVKPDYRDQGYGLRIWNVGLDYLAGRTVGLDGVVAQQANYRKSGFVLAYNNVRYQGTGGGDIADDSDIVALSDIPVAQLHDYDTPFFPADRQRFLECWIAQPKSKALVLRRDGKLFGYGVMRACRAGHKIGPLFADNAATAERLFVALKAHAAPDEAVFLDVPAVNAAAVALAERHDMSAVFETARMYLGEIPRLPLDRLFGVTTFELG